MPTDKTPLAASGPRLAEGGGRKRRKLILESARESLSWPTPRRPDQRRRQAGRASVSARLYSRYKPLQGRTWLRN